MTRRSLAVACASLAVVLGACAKDSASPTTVAVTTAPALASMAPSGGSSAVDPSKPITMTFTMGMMTGMEMLVVLHEGSVTGAQVAGMSAWSADRKTLTFTPSAPLKAKTTYVVHLSPSLQGSNGAMINMGNSGAMGGQMVSGTMMGSPTGMMNGQWGPGMTGAGWKAADSTFGMMFSFTTA